MAKADDEPNSEPRRDGALGARIRASRTSQGSSVQDLAARAGITRSFLSSVERGLAYPSIPVLRSIAAALEVPVFLLFLGEEDAGMVVRREDRRIIKPPGAQMSYELISPDLKHKMEMMLSKFDPGFEGEPGAHEGEECAIVLTGRVVVTIGDIDYELGEGDSIYYDSGIPHKVRVLGEQAAEVLSAVTPPSF